MLNKEELDKLLKIKGEVKGVVFQTDTAFIIKKEGEEGLEKLKKRAKELGYELPYGKAKAMTWYPVGLRPISLLLMKDTFGWTDKDIRELGYYTPSVSFIVKVLMKFVVSLKKIAQKSGEYWRKHYTIGELGLIKFDEKNKELVLRQTNFEIHPIMYVLFEGYYERMFNFVGPNLKGRFEKATYKGKPCHLFIGKW